MRQRPRADGAAWTTTLAGRASANECRRELLRQCEVAEYAMRANQVMSFFVPEHRGHDDLLNAAALVVQAQPLGALRTATGRQRSRPDL